MREAFGLVIGLLYAVGVVLIAYGVTWWREDDAR
jgi:hypothetical protein